MASRRSDKNKPSLPPLDTKLAPTPASSASKISEGPGAAAKTAIALPGASKPASIDSKTSTSLSQASTSKANRPPPTSKHAAANKPSLSATVTKLQSDNPKKVLEALVLIRKYFIKEKTGTDRLRHYGGVEALLSIIKGTNNKEKDVALSIMGNICMDPKVQKKVHALEGISTLGDVVKKSEKTDIINRACRTLANLGQNPECCIAIHECEGLIAAYVNHLNQTEDLNLQLTLIRALRILSGTTSQRQAVLDEEGLKAVSSKLKSEDLAVIKAVYQCLMVLTKKFSVDCARQIIAAAAPAAVINLTEHENDEIRRASFNILLTDWMNHEEMRVGIGNAGGVAFFIELLDKLEDKRKRLIIANALCLSCYEVVNRVRVKDNLGLEIMLKLLEDRDFVHLHDRLISALTCFLYDDVSFEILLNNGVVRIVIKHLKRVAKIKDIPEKLQVVEGSVEIRVRKEKNATTEILVKSTEAAPQSELSLTGTKSECDTKVEDEIQSEIENAGPDIPVVMKDSLEVIEEAAKLTEASETSEETPASTTKSIPKYSIDSPTYKSVVEWQVEDYSEGPKNILDSQLYYEQSSSPASPSSYSSPSHYGPYSPLSVSSYGSYDCSPENSPCPKVRSLSPDLPTSPESCSASVGTFSDSGYPEMSPQLTNESRDSPIENLGSTSPPIFSEPVSPLFLSGLSKEWTNPDLVGFYSSDEDTQSDSEQDSEHGFKLLLRDDIPCRNSQGILNLETLSNLPSPSSTSSLTRMSSDTSDTETASDTKGKQHLKRTPTSTKKGQKRKRDLTPEMRKKILLSVEKSSKCSSSMAINLSEMLSSKGSKSQNARTEKKECPHDKRDFRKHIEYCLIMLLKRISYSSDPSDHLIQPDVMATMLDYIRLASEPFNKCGRILVRLTKNPNCFERLLYEMVPALVDKKLQPSASLLGFKEKSKIQCTTENPKRIATSVSKPGDMHRSMSACTLKESQKVARFHDEVLQQVGSNTIIDNSEDSLHLKSTLFSNIALMAESPFGQGVIDHMFQTGSSEDKSRIAISLAFVCKSRSLFTKAFIESEGFLALYSVMEQDENTSLHHHSLEAILSLLSHHIKEPIQPTLSRAASASKTCQARQDFDITFTFDDEKSEIPAQRSVLVEQSEVFAAMLEGHYSESKQSTIHMPNVTKKAFKILIDHLHEANDPEMNSAPEMDFSLLIEAHGLAHRFMLDDLLDNLSLEIAEKHLGPETVVAVHSQAVLHGAKWLVAQCLSYMVSDEGKIMDKGHSLLKTLLLKSPVDMLLELFQ